MRSVQALVAALAAAVLLQAGVRATLLAPTPVDIERALKLAQAPEQRRAAFHKPYVIRPDHPLVEQIEVITEFRRYVLTAEQQLRMGNWLFAQSVKDAQEQVKPFRGQLTLAARLRFHPHNVLISVPAYELSLGPNLAPLAQTRMPIHATLSGRRGDTTAPLIGATVEAVFDAASVGQTATPAMLSLEGKSVAVVTIDFARLD
jgi:hypothetical protein